MRAKQVLCAVAAFCISLYCCGCDNQTGTIESHAAEAFVYEQAGDVSLMTAMGDTLYTLETGESFQAVLSGYDAEGKQISKVVLPGLNAYDVKCICADENNMYAAISSGGDFLISDINIEDGSLTQLCVIEDLDNIEKIRVCDGKIYWLGADSSKAQQISPFVDKEGVSVYYENGGEIVGCVDIASGEITVSEIDYPVSFSVLDDKVTVYAFDKTGGYYFADYSTPGEKIYTNKLGIISDFEYYGSGGEFAFIGAGDYTGTLPVSKADSESGIIRAANGVYPFSTSDICCSETGYVWIKTADSPTTVEKRIQRYNLNDYNVTGNPIRVIGSQYFTEQPFASGSEIRFNQLSEEGFSLTVLSLDKSFDVAMISSEQGAANDIKEKGAFYPLNDVPGVEEYLDKCFPYIKEAVTDEKGNICMLPVSVNIPVLLYNEKNCTESNINFPAELETFLQTVKQASEVSEYYDCSSYWVVRTQLVGYLARNNYFDTEEFRRIAPMLKEQCDPDIFRANVELYSAMVTMQADVQDSYFSKIYNKMLFAQALYRSQQVNLIQDENLRAAAMPLSSNGKNVAYCTFICVNPYSDRLPETLSFIQNLAENMSQERNSCMLSDNSTYEGSPLGQDLYGIYENGEICFQIPDEVYAVDFDRYCNGEISLDEFITEADRKLNAYLNE